MISKDREYRSFDINTKDEDGSMIIEGMPIVFDSPTLMYEEGGIKFYEIIHHSALDDAQMDDVVLVENHAGTPAARTRNGTLKLTKTDKGLFNWADVSKSSIGEAFYKNVKNGIYDRMSFAFSVLEDENDRKTHTRTITKIGRLYDISAVTFPAYEQTSIQARSIYEAEAELERAEVRKIAQRIKRLRLITETELKNEH